MGPGDFPGSLLFFKAGLEKNQMQKGSKKRSFSAKRL